MSDVLTDLNPDDLLQLDLRPEHQARYERVFAQKGREANAQGDLHTPTTRVESDAEPRFPPAP